ncbi:MAG: hypothetical protein GY754_36880 [bacterium]|nr:hypothetical protein [bacterium]
MAEKTNNIFKDNSLMIIVFTALLAQLIGRVFAFDFIVHHHFYMLWVVVRIVIPCFVLLILAIPFSELGFRKPEIEKKMAKALLIMGGILLTVFIFIHIFPQYLLSYSGSFTAGPHSRLFNFTAFTLTAFVPWEFLHRCFLLMGIIYVLNKRNELPLPESEKIAIVIVWIFEVIFHFAKGGSQIMEAVGMLVFSPILSYITIRTKSVFTGFIAHLIVEYLFIASVILRDALMPIR